MPEGVNPIPAGFSSITPYLVVDDAAAALELYTKIFEAEEVVRLQDPQDGGIIYSELRVGGSTVCVIDSRSGQREQSPTSLGGVTGSLWLYVPEVDAVFDNAIAGGCEALMPVADMFWGDRMGKLQDPFGHVWAIATRVEDKTPEEIAEAAEAAARPAE
jgi:PhnB protein